MQTGRTVTRTFRISEQAFTTLQEEAGRENVSVNTLVNQIILTYTNFDKYIKKLHMMKLPRPTFKRILDAAPEDAIMHAGQLAGSDVPKFFIQAKDGVLSLQTVLSYLRSLGDYGNLFEYTDSVQDRKRTITLAHELGPKGTLFLAHYVQEVFESIDVEPSFSLGDDTIAIELPAQP